MKSHELETTVDAVLSSLECLDIEDRWNVLEEALSRSTKASPKLVIRQDIDPTWENALNLGHIACWHNRYNLGNEQPEAEPDEWFKGLPTGTVTLPLYLLDHSGITMSTKPFSCPWDSGRVGWIVATPEALIAAYGELSERTAAAAVGAMELEVKDYDCHLRGQVWGYEFGNDSCWGFVGDELKDTGLENMVPKEALPQLEEAWEVRN